MSDKKIFSVSIKKEVIDLLKKYAEETGISQSRIIENGIMKIINDKKGE